MFDRDIGRLRTAIEAEKAAGDEVTA